MTTQEYFGATARIISRRADFTVEQYDYAAKRYVISPDKAEAHYAFVALSVAGVRVGAAQVHVCLSERTVIEMALELARTGTGL